MSYTYEHKSTAQHAFRYRFTCEQCGQTTQWYPIEVEREAVVSTGGGYRDLASSQASSGAKAALIRRMEQLHKDVEAGRYDLLYQPQKDEGSTNHGLEERVFSHYECPNCKAIQSWIVPSLDKEGAVAWALLFGVGLPALWFVVLLLAPKDGGLIALGAWHLLIFPGLLVAGCFIGSILHGKKLKRRLNGQTGTTKNTPEIDWCGM